MEKLKAKKWMRRTKDGRVHYANVKVVYDIRGSIGILVDRHV